MLREVFKYYGLLFKFTNGKLLILSAISLFAGLLDGLGLTMLLPLLNSSELHDGDSATPGVINTIFNALNLTTTFGNVLLVMALIFFVKMIIKFGEGALQSRIVSHLLTKWRHELVLIYSKVKYSYYTSRNAGHFINILNTQVNQATHFVQQYSSFLSRIITGVVYLVLATILSPLFTLYALVAGVIMVFMLRGLLRKTQTNSRMYAEEHGVVNKYIIQMVHSFKYLRGAGQYDVMQRQIHKSIKNLEDQRFKSGLYTAVMQSVQEPAPAFVVLALLFVYVQVQGNALAPILVTLVLFYRTMNSFVMSQSAWQASLNFAGSIEILEREYKDSRQTEGMENGLLKMQRISTDIHFRNVSFGYGDKMVLKDVSFKIPANQTTAIIGPSGSGKTTIVDLLVKLYSPVAGEILVDGIELNRISTNDWQRSIGFVTQDSVVFDDTIYNNISLWDGPTQGRASRVADAAKMSNSLEFIDSMSMGFNTSVGERGIQLSGGQRQRLAIARELYKEPMMLILDEATSALDTSSEKMVQNSIAELHGSMTVVIVAHRLATIKDADMVVVLDKGKVIEQGSYLDLVNQDSTLRQMLSEQGIK